MYCYKDLILQELKQHYMKLKNKTVNEVASLTNYSPDAIRKMCSGKRTITLPISNIRKMGRDWIMSVEVPVGVVLQRDTYYLQ